MSRNEKEIFPRGILFGKALLMNFQFFYLTYGFSPQRLTLRIHAHLNYTMNKQVRWFYQKNQYVKRILYAESQS